MLAVVEIVPQDNLQAEYMLPALEKFFKDHFGKDKVYVSYRRMIGELEPVPALLAVSMSVIAPAQIKAKVDQYLFRDLGFREKSRIGEGIVPFEVRVVREPEKMTYGPFSKVVKERRTDKEYFLGEAEDEKPAPKKKRAVKKPVVPILDW